MDEKSLKTALKDLAVPRIVYYDEIDSTNEQALNLMASGLEEFTLLVADQQTAGRGRLGRKWVTTPGSSLAFTVVLHPKEEERQVMGFFSFLGGLALCIAIETHCGARPQLKWPNDVLLGGKKTAGILAESSFQGETLAGTALGIGVNLLEGSVPPLEEVMFPATCVAEHCFYLPPREDFLAEVMRYLIQWRPRIMSREFLHEYQARLALTGQRVFLIPPSTEEIDGTLMGVDREGHLVLELDDGEVRAFPVGDVKLRQG
ncbi:MAG: biotin--[acetyl-CoA-carboxylase] ligase [Chloroflexi bacterium]|nr:biotin--[acetyl-CoA-carboxylase] ligase [Chloroflexota bacterium]